MNAPRTREDVPSMMAGAGVDLPQLDELAGFAARSSDGEVGVVEGVSLIVRSQTPEAGLRIVPLEAIADLSPDERTISLAASVEPHSFPRHRSVRRLGDKWRVDLTLDAPRMDPEYWLAHCRGFLVNSPRAYIGVVDEVMVNPGGQPEALLVRAGCLRLRDVIFAVEDVVEIVPQAKVIGVRGLPVAHEPEPAHDRTVVSKALSWLRHSD
jgi:hypothetical protein